MNRAVWKDTVTLYSFYREQITGACTYKRTVLRDCFWLEDNASARQRAGTADVYSVTLLVPWSDEYIPADRFARLLPVELESYRTIAVGPSPECSYLVPFECPFEFGWGTADSLAVEYIRPFEREYAGRFKRAGAVNALCFGSRRLWHILVRC